MKVRVRLFAVARELAQQELVELDLPEPVTIADVRGGLAMAVPALTKWLPHLHFALGTEYASDGVVVTASDEIACIPPVSGG